MTILANKSLFDLDDIFFSNIEVLQVKECSQIQAVQNFTNAKHDQDDVVNINLSISLTNYRCTTCLIDFDSSENLREHHRTDLHKTNLQILQTHDAVCLDNLDKDNSTENSNKSCEITFCCKSNIKLTLWKVLLIHQEDKHDLKQRVPIYVHSLKHIKFSISQIAIFLLCGGRLACGIFQNQKIICHKAAVYYTVRKGQGGSQVTADNTKSNRIKSSGSTLRRNQQTKFVENVQRTLFEWRTELARCSLIFYYAPSNNRKILLQNIDVSNKTSHQLICKTSDLACYRLQSDDNRVRTIPFSVQRPTFLEVQQVFDKLTSIKSS